MPLWGPMNPRGTRSTEHVSHEVQGGSPRGHRGCHRLSAGGEGSMHPHVATTVVRGKEKGNDNRTFTGTFSVSWSRHGQGRRPQPPLRRRLCNVLENVSVNTVFHPKPPPHCAQGGPGVDSGPQQHTVTTVRMHLATIADPLHVEILGGGSDVRLYTVLYVTEQREIMVQWSTLSSPK